MAKKKTFETSMAQLESIVKQLENGQLALDDAMKLFEQGMEHSAFCMEKLDEAEKKITILIQDNKGNIKEEPFENDTREI